MKTREDVRGAYGWIYQGINAEPTLHQTCQTARAVGTFQSVDGVETGRFVPGTLRINPVTMRKVTTVSSDCKSDAQEMYRGKLYRYRLTGDIAAWALPKIPSTGYAGSWSSNLEALSVAKALEKLHSADDNVALWLAELRETIGLLSKPLSSIRKLILKLRKTPEFTGKTLREIADSGSGTWLEYRYGLVPLMSDVQMLLGLLHKQLRRPHVRFGRQRSSTTVKSSTTWKGEFAAYVWLSEISFLVETVTRSTSVVYYKYEGASKMEDILSTYGFSRHQVLSLMWELTPYSFVVDWFLNVGSWLASINPKPGVSILGCCTSQKTTTIHTAMGGRSRCYGFTQQYVPLEGVHGTRRTEEVLVRRNSTVSLTPTINANILNVKRILDSISLLWQNMPRKRN